MAQVENNQILFKKEILLTRNCMGLAARLSLNTGTSAILKKDKEMAREN